MFRVHELKLVSWALVSWSKNKNSFRQHSFPEEKKISRKNAFCEHSFREQSQKPCFVSNFKSLVSKSAKKMYVDFRLHTFSFLWITPPPPYTQTLSNVEPIISVLNSPTICQLSYTGLFTMNIIWKYKNGKGLCLCCGGYTTRKIVIY